MTCPLGRLRPRDFYVRANLLANKWECTLESSPFRLSATCDSQFGYDFFRSVPIRLYRVKEDRWPCHSLRWIRILTCVPYAGAMLGHPHVGEPYNCGARFWFSAMRTMRTRSNRRKYLLEGLLITLAKYRGSRRYRSLSQGS